ncbi:MAG: DegV family protein [Lachnospiraceae bacterium]|nr:DegV family protein [Lachnospiraceae bacterium]
MIHLLVDSSSDYTMAEVKSKGIYYVPISITLDDKSYQDGIDLTPDAFYEILTSSKDFPKTAQPSPKAFADVFNEAKAQGDEVICILLSSALSGTCQSAYLAKKMVDYEGIYIVDSLTATIMIKVLADYAYKLIADGLKATEIVTKIEALKSKVKVIAALDTLEYLSRGGRLNRTAAAIGELASLKPIIQVTEEGTVSVVGKCLGRNKALMFLMKSLSTKKLHPDFPLYSVYTYGTENCEKLEEKLSEHGYHYDDRCQVGSTIGTHIGPGAFGIIYVEE